MEVRASNLGRFFGHRDWDVSYFSSASPAKCRDVSTSGPRLLSSKFFPVYQLWIINSSTFHYSPLCALAHLMISIQWCQSRASPHPTLTPKVWRSFNIESGRTDQRLWIITLVTKCKAIPVQSWIDPEGSRMLSVPDFKTNRQHEVGKVVSFVHRPL